MTSTSWTPHAGIYSTIEDQVGSGAYYLNPGWGGQAYDAEALYATIIGSKLYIALATGHNPLTRQNPGSNSYGAGDFAIDFGKWRCWVSAWRVWPPCVVVAPDGFTGLARA